MIHQESTSNTSAISSQERPFKGKITGSFVNEPTSNPLIFAGVANANGNVTHLGVFSKVTRDIINIFLRKIEGTFVMTSTGGEKLTGNYGGTFSLETTSGTLSWILNATITGGTGRFSFATGEFVFRAEGTYEITGVSVSGIYTETFDGTINY